MANSGVARIDQLFGGAATAAPIVPGDTDTESVGALQDLLRGHNHGELPSLLGVSRGVFGLKTAAAVQDFRSKNGLGPGDRVDGAAMQKLVQVDAPTAIASRPYVTLKLDFEFDGMLRVMLLTTLMEGKGAFSVLNQNTDTAGLSFGIIQWAQKPGRLPDILIAFRDRDAGEFARIFGDGDASLAARLIAHTQRPNGGVDPDTGETTDGDFDLVEEPWVTRFTEAGRSPVFQAVQITTARAAFDNSFARLKAFAPELTTERAVAFMLDLANQHGDGGAKAIHAAAKRDGQTLPELIDAMIEESVKRLKPKFQAGTRNRRTLFAKTPLLSDETFVAG
jgi:peptidoglycan hydrolase-like protein with peptidoglycan-binding domain